MFHKYKKLVVFVDNKLVWPARALSLILSIYFAFDVYEILDSGIAEYKFSEDSYRDEDNFGFWLKILEKSVYALFCVIMIMNVRSVDEK